MSVLIEHYSIWVNLGRFELVFGLVLGLFGLVLVSLGWVGSVFLEFG